MNPPKLAVSDKVVLHPWSFSPVAAKPRLKRDRVYCVEKIVDKEGSQFVGLVGVEFRQLRPDKRARDPHGAITLYHADKFMRVDVAAEFGKRKEGH